MKKVHFIYAILLYIGAVFYLASTTPISPHEAKIFYNASNIVSYLMHQGQILVDGFLGLRIFFIGFGFVSIILFYQVSKRHFTADSDRYIATSIFMLLPGMLTGIVLANISIVVLSIVLLFIHLYEKGDKIIWPFLLLILFFIHEASMIFFFALLLYAFRHKDRYLGILSLTFLITFIVLSKGIDISGRPIGHFVEIFGLYVTLFSPFLFLYFFYATYRILLREKKSLVWYISYTALLFSLLLSLRQRIYITDFAPYMLFSVILMLETYHNSIRVRLPQFQTYYKKGFTFVIGFLLVTASLVVFHKPIYDFMGHSSKHFAQRIYYPYTLALALKAKNIHCFDDAKGREAYQLKYYQIETCSH